MSDPKPSEADYLAAGRAYWDETVHEREIKILAQVSTNFRAAVQSAFAAGVRAARVAEREAARRVVDAAVDAYRKAGGP